MRVGWLLCLSATPLRNNIYDRYLGFMVYRILNTTHVSLNISTKIREDLYAVYSWMVYRNPFVYCFVKNDKSTHTNSEKYTDIHLSVRHIVWIFFWRT